MGFSEPVDRRCDPAGREVRGRGARRRVRPSKWPPAPGEVRKCPAAAPVDVTPGACAHDRQRTDPDGRTGKVSDRPLPCTRAEHGKRSSDGAHTARFPAVLPA